MGALVQSLVVAVLVLRIARMPFRLGFDRAVARRLLAFGAPLALGLGIESVLLFSDSMIVGNVLGTVALGFYLLAFNISSWVPGLVGTAVRYVSIPAFSRLAEGEKEEFALGVQRSLPLMIGVVAPIAAVMVVLAPAMIHVLYGAEWAPAAEALRFLAFVMVARMFTALVFDVQTGLGNTRVTVWLNLVWLVALLPALWVGRARRRHAWCGRRARRRRRRRGHPAGRLAAAPVRGRHAAGPPEGCPSRPRRRGRRCRDGAPGATAGRAVRPAGGGRRAGDRRLRADRAAGERVGRPRGAWRRRWLAVRRGTA